MNIGSKRHLPPIIWPIAALALVLIFNAIFTSGFFHVELRDGRYYGSVIDVLNRGTPTMLVSLGMTLVIATGGVDLSVGAVMAISGAAAACLIERPDYSPLAAINAGGSITLIIIISLFIALLCGLWNGLLVAVLDVQPIVATLILMVAGRGIAQLLTGGQNVAIEPGRFEFASDFFLRLPLPITITFLALIAAILLTRATGLGLLIESAGNNSLASRYSGVNTRLIILFVYVICGVFSGIAGLIGASDIKQADASNSGLYMELDAILAVVIGGTSLLGGRFSLVGAIIGAILIQTFTTTILTRGIPEPVTYVVKAALIIGVCLLQAPKFRQIAQRYLARYGKTRPMGGAT